MNIKYHKASLADKKALYELGVALNKYNLSHDSEESLFWDGWEKDIEQEVEDEINNPLISIYLAETEDNKPVGYILAKNCEHCGHFEIDQLYVGDAYRGQKVGHKLMDLIVNESKKAGLSLQLEVYKTNTNAIKFYESYGFKESGLVLRMDF